MRLSDEQRAEHGAAPDAGELSDVRRRPMIERTLTLRTDRFNVTTPSAAFINPRCFGQDFAVWLKRRLEEQGLIPSEPIQEDFGWVLLVPYRAHRFTVSIGVMDESIGRTPAEWSVGVAYEKPLNGFLAWFRHRPTAELADLSRVLEDALRSDIGISCVTPA
jgi:hypothetical protein